MKYLASIITLVLFCSRLFCQVEVTGADLTEEQKQDLLNHIFDSTKLLDQFGQKACKCIDSISLRGINAKDASSKTASCIDQQVEVYDLTLAMMRSLTSDTKKIEVVLNNDKDSERYTKTYRLLERWRRDSCKSLMTLVAVNNEEAEHSFSKDEKAMEDYNKGADLLKLEKYKEAIPYFEKAVKIDPNFIFAWDNLGISCRRTGDLEKALKAYKKSLSIDPKSVTALQNIPIVYEYMKEYDKALEAYRDMESIYPDNPEPYYGAGRLYLSYKNDLEKALDQLCKSYNIYVKMNSAYRVDAEKLISMVYGELKKQNKEDVFNKILKDNGISVSQ